MKDTLNRVAINKVVILALPLVIAGSAANAAAIDAIAGRWCGEITDYTFDEHKLVVTFHADGTKRVLEISASRSGTDDSGRRWIALAWKPEREGYATLFSGVGDDSKEIVQESNTGGANGPKRIFKRCLDDAAASGKP